VSQVFQISNLLKLAFGLNVAHCTNCGWLADKLKMLESHKCSMLATGLAVGLAAKELVSNFIGGALIFLARPFVIGESIEVLKTESMYLSHVHTFQAPVVRSCLIATIVKYGWKCGRTLGFQVSDFDCVDGWCT
jgi:hypothetical protein